MRRRTLADSFPWHGLGFGLRVRNEERDKPECPERAYGLRVRNHDSGIGLVPADSEHGNVRR